MLYTHVHNNRRLSSALSLVLIVAMLLSSSMHFAPRVAAHEQPHTTVPSTAAAANNANAASNATHARSQTGELESEHTIAITDSGFSPATVTIARGDSITWVNETQQTYGVQVDVEQQQQDEHMRVFLPLITRSSVSQRQQQGVSLQAQAPQPTPTALPLAAFSWSSDDIAPGQSATTTFSETGTFVMRLFTRDSADNEQLFTGESGTIEVEQADEPTPTPMTTVTPTPIITDTISPTPTPIITDTISPTPTPTPTEETGNKTPVAQSGSLTAHQNSSITFDLASLVKDPEGDALTFAIATEPQHGTATLKDSRLTYTPETDYVGQDSLTYEVSDGQHQTGVQQTITVDVVEQTTTPPPNSSTLAPPLDTTGATSLADATAFLYTGPNAIQTGVEAGTFAPTRTAVVRGKVFTRDEQPLPGVTITVMGHPEYGQTVSRADGMFDMAVNGGSRLKITYQAEGYLAAQRQVNVPWRDYVWVDDVVMIGVDPIVTSVDLTSDTPMQIAQSSTVSDTDGTRQASLLIPQNTQANMVMTDGTSKTLTMLDIRATEYTVGDNGPETMPAELPPQSGYTYALEYSVDEALAEGAIDVQFSQPLYHYVENFLDFPVGTIVPVGYYDRQKGAWVPSQNGRVVKVISITDGMADLDTDGDDAVDNNAEMGITDEERTQIATLYQAGESLWRVPIEHFTPWDCNWPYGPPADAEAPGGERPQKPGDDNVVDPCKSGGSIVECENQVLGETIGIAGTSFSLNYRSNRVPGPDGARTLTIPLSGATLPSGVKQIELEIEVAGQRINKQSFAAEPNQSYDFLWDGKDGYGRTLHGRHLVNVRIGYTYTAVYQEPGQQFDQAFAAFSGVPMEANETRQEVTLWRDWQVTLSATGSSHIGGWTMNVQHTYDTTGKTLHLGNGQNRSADAMQMHNTIETVVGRNDSFSVAGLAIGPDGSLYIADEDNHRILRLGTDGSITTVAGNGKLGYSGDGGPATEASLDSPYGVAVGADGNLYIADRGNRRVRRVGPDGIITTIAGGGSQDDGIPATETYIRSPEDVAIGADGSLYINTGNAVRRVGPDGIITTVAGNGKRGFSGDGGPATEASLNMGGIQLGSGIAIGTDGSLYITDTGNERIRRVGPDGIITTVAGNGEWGYSGDGGPATSASLNTPYDVAIGADGSIYIADKDNRRVRRVGPDGIITTVAGNGEPHDRGDGGPATDASLSNPRGIAIGADGNLYIAEVGTIRRVGPDGIITTVVGKGAYGGDGWLATRAIIGLPKGVAIDADGSIYIADSSNSRIRRVGTDGIITTVAGNVKRGYSGDGGPATQASLDLPQGVAVGADGSIYIADTDNHRIRRVGPDGIITTVAGNGERDYSGDGGPATEASLNAPQGIAIGTDGSLYIADTNNNRIRRVGPDGIITTVAGNGEEGYSGNGGPATEASLYAPEGIAIGTDGSFYITTGRFVRRVGPDGIITTVAGNGIYAEYGRDVGDGEFATEVSLRNLSGVAVGADGSLYIADIGNDRIRRVGPDGIITTVAGNGFYGDSGDGGPATQASLRGPRGVAIGADGSLYIADTTNYIIRRVAPAMPGFSVGDILIPSEDGKELYVFSNVGRHLRTLNAITGAMIYEFDYNDTGVLMSITDGSGNITRIERTDNITPTAIVSPDGQRTTLTLDANGYLSSVTNPANETTQLGYGEGGLLTSFTNPRGSTSTFTYDDEGRLVKDEDAAGGFQTLARTDTVSGYVALKTTAMGRTTSYRVEQLPTGGQRRVNILSDGTQYENITGTDGKTTATAADGTVINTTYGPDPRFGMLAPLYSEVKVTTPGGLESVVTTERNVTLGDANDPLSLTSLVETMTINDQTYTSSYNAASQTVSLETPMGRRETTTVDEQGRPVVVAVPGLEAVRYTYDDRGRLTTLSQGSGANSRTATLTYNSDGYLASASDPLNRTASYSYDAAGRVTQSTLPDGRVIDFTYDANGNLTSITPPSRPKHTFAYDDIDAVSSYTPPSVGSDAIATTYSYNADKQITQLKRPDGKTIDMTYDAGGRVSKKTIARGDITFAYDDTSGNVQTITAPDGGTVSYGYDGSLLTNETWAGSVAGSVDYVYDNNFRLASSSVNDEDPITYEYNDDSLLTQAGAMTLNYNEHNDLLIGTSLGYYATDDISYNSFGETTGYTFTARSNDRYNVEYTRDKLGRIVQKSETIDDSTNVYNYTYDLAGRLTEVWSGGVLTSTYTYDDNGNRLQATIGGTTVQGTYDDQDRMLTYGNANYSYTASGDLASMTSGGKTTSYEYDELGNLLSVTLPDSTQIAYVIDGTNRRIGKKVNGTLTQGFLYSGQLAPIAELDGDGAVVSRFVYATHANVPDYMMKDGATYRIVTDHLGSPRLVINTSSGEVAQRMDYDEWGNVVRDTNPGFQPFGFAGGLYDRDTGFVRFGARDYDPATGRWTTKDPIGFQGGLNLYGYVLGDPVNWVDPSGFIIDTIVDIVFIGYDLYRLIKDGPCNLGENLTALGGDVIGAFVPGLTGVGAGVRVAKAASKAEGAVEAGTKVYRVWGDGAGAYGRSWTHVDPRTVSNYRDAAGLPNTNSGRFVTEGVLIDTSGVKTRSALPLDGNRGGLPEVIIPDPGNQIRIDRVSGVNPAF